MSSNESKHKEKLDCPKTDTACSQSSKSVSSSSRISFYSGIKNSDKKANTDGPKATMYWPLSLFTTNRKAAKPAPPEINLDVDKSLIEVPSSEILTCTCPGTESVKTNHRNMDFDTNHGPCVKESFQNNLQVSTGMDSKGVSKTRFEPPPQTFPDIEMHLNSLDQQSIARSVAANNYQSDGSSIEMSRTDVQSCLSSPSCTSEVSDIQNSLLDAHISTAERAFQNDFVESAYLDELDSKNVSQIYLNSSLQSLGSDVMVDRTPDQSFTQLNETAILCPREDIELKSLVNMPRATKAIATPSVASSHVILSNSAIKYTECQSVHSRDNLTCKQNSLMTINTHYSDLRRANLVNSFDAEFPKFAQGSKLFFNSQLEEEFPYFFDVRRQRRILTRQGTQTKSYEILPICGKPSWSYSRSSKSDEYLGTKLYDGLMTGKKLKTSRSIEEAADKHPKNKTLRYFDHKHARSADSNIIELMQECDEQSPAVSEVEIHRTSEKCDIRVQSPEPGDKNVDEVGFSRIHLARDSDIGMVNDYYEDYDDLEDDFYFGERSSEYASVKENQKIEMSPTKKDSMTDSIGGVSSLILDEPVIVSYFDEKTHELKEMLLYSDESLDVVTSELPKGTSRVKILETLFKRSRVYDGKPLHIVFDTSKFIANEAIDKSSVYAEKITKMTTKTENLGIGTHVEQETSEKSSTYTEKITKITAKTESLGLGTYVEREPSEKTVDEPCADELGVGDNNKIHSMLVELFGTICDQDTEQQQNDAAKSKSTPSVNKEESAISGRPVSSEPCDLAKPKPKLIIRLCRRKKSRTSLKRVNVEEIITNVFRKLFQSYSKLGGRLKSGSVITKSNSNYWLKKAGVVDDELSLRMAGEHFATVARRKVVLNIADYVQFLVTVARGKQMIVRDLVNQLTTCQPPAPPQPKKIKPIGPKKDVATNVKVSTTDCERKMCSARCTRSLTNLVFTEKTTRVNRNQSSFSNVRPDIVTRRRERQATFL